MRNLLRATIAVALMVAAFAAAAPAIAGDESFIRTHNETDKYVWITVYSKPMGLHMKQDGAWCVGPHASDDHGLRAAIKEVRAELSDGGCQRLPRTLDQTWAVQSREIRGDVVTFTGFVKKAGGIYIFTH